jgi:hypothetical protein
MDVSFQRAEWNGYQRGFHCTAFGCGAAKAKRTSAAKAVCASRLYGTAEAVPLSKAKQIPAFAGMTNKRKSRSFALRAQDDKY